MNLKRFALIGCPLGHSLSPFIHNELMKLCGIEGAYDLCETEADKLASFYASALRELDGFNVTIPHKTNIIPFLDELSPEAELIGAVNTVKIENNKAKGYNTDCIGFLRSLKGAKIEIGKSVLVCGSGGVSRMFAFECVKAGAELTLAVRPSGLEKAKRIKAEIEKKLGNTAKIITLDKVNKGYSLIINGTPSGMYPDTESSPLNEDAVSLSKAVFDAVYNPAQTKLLSYAKEHNMKYVNGLSMLVWQAAAAEEIWNGVSFTEDEINRITLLTETELEKR